MKKSFLLFKTKAKKNEITNQNYLLIKILRYVSLHISFLLSKINVSANSITLIGIISSVISYCFFYASMPNIAFLFGFLAIISDYIDGDIARFKSSTSKTGSYLDVIHHIIVQGVIILGMITYLFNQKYINNVLFFLIPLLSIIYPIVNQFAIESAILKHMIRNKKNNFPIPVKLTSNYEVNESKIAMLAKYIRFFDFPYILLLIFMIVAVNNFQFINYIFYAELFLICVTISYLLLISIIIYRVVSMNKVEHAFKEAMK
ncbi:CDP-alcohol phosphatidyltransferase family protein [Shewanella sp.]|uniref:CDP-alcohol phosphatidyltransferase family protein n=1 Tax=Shewanella sp. TaxID=50422 RepID=UPI004048DCE7